MKKLFAMLLALSLLLSLSAGFTASAEGLASGIEALFTGEEKVFDPNLVGAWVLDKSEKTDGASNELLENLFTDLFFLPDGSFSSAVLPFPYVAAMGQRAPKASTAVSGCAASSRAMSCMRSCPGSAWSPQSAVTFS